jgi:hypothetical protein
VAAALMGATLALAACSSDPASPGVANLSATSTTAPSSGGSTKASPLAYSQCMRAHGVTDFPDPDSQGRIDIQAGPGSDLDPNNPTFQAAQQACQSLRPKPTAAQQHQFQQAALKFAQCMRAHGVSDFPDPSANGGIRIRAGQGSDLDPNNPTFKAAQQACQKDLPGAKLGGGTRIQVGQAPGSSSGSGSGSVGA